MALPRTRSAFPALVLSLALLTTASSASATYYHHPTQRYTAVEYLSKVHGAQALVGAVLYVEQERVLDFSLVSLLDDRHADFVLFAPSNSAFEKLLGVDLEGLSAEQIRDALPNFVPASAVADILLKHVVFVKRANLWSASEARLLAKGSVEAADGSRLKVSIGAEGVRVNESNITKADVPLRNAVVHFIDTVL